jgi:hypothetical protein
MRIVTEAVQKQHGESITLTTLKNRCPGGSLWVLIVSWISADDPIDPEVMSGCDASWDRGICSDR